MGRRAAWLILLLVLGLLAACGPKNPTPTSEPLPPRPLGATPTPTATAAPESTPAPSATPGPDSVTFVVQAPPNTPEEDAVFFASGPFFAEKMADLGGGRWAITLDWDELNDPKWGAGDSYSGPAVLPGGIQYAYTRGWGYLGAEASVDDPGVEFWATARTYTWQQGETVDDVVERWRWFPASGETLPVYNATLTEFAPRLNGQEFQAGVLVADLWDEALVHLTTPTNTAAQRDAAATWVSISPPWDYGAFDPLPVIAGDTGTVPGYPDDALRHHIRETKADGLKVLLFPQVCCTTLTGDPRLERSAEWVEEWFDQYKAFMVHHAIIGAEEGADAMLFDWSGANFLPSVYYDVFTIEELQAKWATVVAAVRAEFSGPVGYNILPGHAYEAWGEPWPWGDFAYIADQFDFIGMSFWAGLAGKDDPTQAELDDAAERAFQASLDPVFEATGLPQILSAIAFGSFDGAARNELGVYDVALDAYFNENESTFVDDHAEQAMVMQAIMKAVASRPYVVGAYPFLYQYLALPTAADYSIRGKAAESVIARWYRLATGR